MGQITAQAYRSALVTGASSGIGASCARLLAAAGTELVLVARRLDRLTEVAARLSAEHKVNVEVLAADLAEPRARAPVEARLADRARPVELLVNNAGFGTSGPFAGQPVRSAESQIQLNVVALTRLAHAALPGMLERGHGGILNVSSMAGFLLAPGSATYSATKAFVTSFSESLHAEVRKRGVHVTALCPGFTRTGVPCGERGGSARYTWIRLAGQRRCGEGRPRRGRGGTLAFDTGRAIQDGRAAEQDRATSRGPGCSGAIRPAVRRSPAKPAAEFRATGDGRARDLVGCNCDGHPGSSAGSAGPVPAPRPDRGRWHGCGAPGRRSREPLGRHQGPALSDRR